MAAHDGKWMTSSQAAARLRVKPQTLYAYVSRGILTSHPAPGSRSRRFHADEVEQVATRGRRRRAPGGSELLVESGLTLLDPADLRYRGWGAVEAARTARYEQVAEWLWTGSAQPPPPWVAAPEPLAVARAAQACLPPGASLVDRMRVAVATSSTVDPFHGDRRPEAVVLTARSLISILVEILPPPSGSPGGGSGSAPDGGPAPAPLPGGPPRGRRASSPAGWARGSGQAPEAPSIAARLWSKLSSGPPTAPMLAALDAALVLLADHELAPSTLAARIAASGLAGPYQVVQTGLGVMAAQLPGAAQAMVAEVAAGAGPGRVLGRLLAVGGKVPGFGGLTDGAPDPRFAGLIGLVESLAPPQRWAPVRQLIDTAAARALPPPNVDLATAALAHVCGLVPDATEAVFAVARSAGWIAHALEEYPRQSSFRIRAVYTGPREAHPPGR